ncbi:MAG: hypothetical protein KDC44_16170 [Phaeodactylibacter sp.]|nr:hypothetical protein [Phaeodactylibacter sp.]
MNKNQRKYQLIEKIIGIQDEQLLIRLEAFVHVMQRSDEGAALLRPLRPDLQLTDLVREQKYEGLDPEQFKYVVEHIGIQEKIEDLLEQL